MINYHQATLFPRNNSSYQFFQVQVCDYKCTQQKYSTVSDTSKIVAVPTNTLFFIVLLWLQIVHLMAVNPVFNIITFPYTVATTASMLVADNTT